MDEEPKTRLHAISAKSLTSHGYAVCFFPEQPTREVIIEEQPEITEEPQEPQTLQEVEEVVVEQTKVIPLEAILSKPPKQVVRLYWRNRLVYLLAFVSFSLSLNNIYHFPMKIYRYGENFFIPYTVVTIFIGYPLHVLQTSMGQYSQRGSLWIWECAPLCFGIGLAMLTACAAVSLYYNIFAAYSLVYFAHCFNTVLPWTYCSSVSLEKNHTCVSRFWYISENVTLASKDYFYDVILNTPHRYPAEVWSFTSLKWWLCVSLLVSWIFVYVVTLRSSRSIGKMAIFIVVFGYFGILTLSVIAFQVKNSGKLLLRNEKPISVLNVRMWVAAVMQVLLELGISYGIPIVYGSYCRFRNFVLTDSVILCTINYFNSIIFFYLFFSFMRSFSCKFDTISWKLPDHTIGVIYIIYTELFSTLSGSHIWCVIFFFMLFLVIIGTQIAITEAIMAAVYDKFPKLSHYRCLLNLIICFFFFTLGLTFCFTNGYYGALIFHYVPSFYITVPLSCLFIVGIIFIYGFKQYSQNMKTMRRYNLSAVVKLFFWIVVVLLVLTFLVEIFSVDSLIFRSNEEHSLAGWLTTAVIVYPVVLCGILWTLYCCFTRTKLLRSTNAWMKFVEEKKQENSQFTVTYSKSYTWEWNNY